MNSKQETFFKEAAPAVLVTFLGALTTHLTSKEIFILACSLRKGVASRGRYCMLAGEWAVCLYWIIVS